MHQLALHMTRSTFVVRIVSFDVCLWLPTSRDNLSLVRKGSSIFCADDSIGRKSPLHVHVSRVYAKLHYWVQL